MAGAYVVFVALILVYVAIIGAKIARIERQISELVAVGGRPSDRRAAGHSAPTHKTAPLPLREKLALPDGRAARVLARARRTTRPSTRRSRSPPATAPSSTWWSADPVEAESAALGILVARRRASGRRSCSARSTRCAAATPSSTSSRVTAGLDSMIVGEAEVQGQVKRAYELALVEDVTGPVTNRLFRDALAAGKRVRTETDVSRSSVSVSSVAVKLARRLPRRPRRPARARDRRGRERRAHGARAARPRRGGAVRREPPLRPRARAGAALRRPGDRVRRPAGASSSTPTSWSARPASPHQIVGREELEFVAASRRAARCVLIDLAVPRDIEPGVRDCPGIALYDMDDLQREVARNLGGREAEAERGASARARGGRPLRAWLGTLDVVPTISALRARGDEIVEQVLRENESRWESLSEADRERLADARARDREPAAARADAAPEGAAGDGTSTRYVHALRELFGLEARHGGARRGRAAEVTPPRRTPRAAPPAGDPRSARAAARSRWRRRAAVARARCPASVELVADHDLRRQRLRSALRERRQVALRQGDRGGAARGRGRPRRALREGRPGRASRTASRSSPCRERDDPRDALVRRARRSTRSPEGARVGTRSLRRRAAAAGRAAGPRRARAARQRRHAAAQARRGRLRRDRARARGPRPARPRGRGAAARSTAPCSCPRPARAASRSRRAPDDETRRGVAGSITRPRTRALPDGRARGGRGASTRPATRRSARTLASRTASCG